MNGVFVCFVDWLVILFKYTSAKSKNMTRAIQIIPDAGGTGGGKVAKVSQALKYRSLPN